MAGDASRFNGIKGGRPKGVKNKATLEKQIVLDAYKERVLKNTQRILDAQLSLGTGQQFLYKITTFKNGTKSKPELITNPSIIEAFLDGEYGDGENLSDDKEFYYITTKEPSIQAIDSMYNRVFGKPIESLEVSGRNGEPMQFILPGEIKKKHGIDS